MNRHSVDSDNRSEVLTGLHMVYLGGPHDGVVADFPRRDFTAISLSRHEWDGVRTDTYQRTTFVHFGPGPVRTVFQHAGQSFTSVRTGLVHRLAVRLRFRSPIALEI